MFGFASALSPGYTFPLISIPPSFSLITFVFLCSHPAYQFFDITDTKNKIRLAFGFLIFIELHFQTNSAQTDYPNRYVGFTLYTGAASIITSAPSGTSHNPDKSPLTLPMTFTADATLISSPREAGVFPKNIQKALPVGQYPNSPTRVIPA